MSDAYLLRPESADFLTALGFPTTKNTLQKFATAGGGPIYRLFGHRALYTRDDLVAWAEARLSTPRRSTSDAKAAA